MKSTDKRKKGGEYRVDTSTKYIEMCEKIEETQKLWEPKVGDYYAEGNGIYLIDNEVGSFVRKTEQRYRTVWLPRQDQIQEIFFKDGYFPISEFKKFEEFFWPHWTDYASFEQAWLSFLMFRKYNKIWKNNMWETME